MSWIEQINSDFIITTGDGKEYKPNWLNASRQVEYNVSEFDFIDKGGTLVKRGFHRGTKYQLQLYFQGEGHLDDSRNFELSARDRRAWTILHPFYGSLTVQPVSLTFYNSAYNVTEIKGIVIETISQRLPQATVSPIDKISVDKSTTDELAAQSFASNVQPDIGDINSMTSNNNDLYNIGSKSAGINSQEYFNTFVSANSAVLNATAEPLAAMRKAQALINAPAFFQESVQVRMRSLLDQFDSLREKLSSILGISEKRIYESTLGSLVSAMAVSSSTGSYGSKNEVIIQIENLLGSYNQYLTDLDSIQSTTGGTIDGYIPDSEVQISLNDLINFTASHLFDISIDSRNERIVILEEDSNLIELTHRFYGLDDEDENITELVSTNDISLSEYFTIKKGRAIAYYV